MTLADEVVFALKAVRTVFTCACGGILWHVECDTFSRLACESCDKAMNYRGTDQETAADFMQQRLAFDDAR